MIRSTQTKEKPRTQSRQYLSNPTDKDGNIISTVSSNQRLTRSQILTFWGGAVVLLLATFIIGFKAGQKIGAKEVLDQAANQIVRLPIVRPIGRDSETVSLAKLGPAEANNKPKTEESERKIDFSSLSEGSTAPAKEPAKEPDIDPLNPPTNVAATDTKKKVDARYEVIYPGKDKFLPPDTKKLEREAKEKEVKEVPFNPVKPEPEKPAFNPSTLAPSPGWYVQVTAVPTVSEVESLYEKLKAKDISLRVESASIRNKPYYRILIGPFPDREVAMEKRATSKSLTSTPGEPFIRQVK